MNKAELIDSIAKAQDTSKASAKRALDAVLRAITISLRKGERVELLGFGTFSVAKRIARTGRNPRTGAAIKIKAARVPRFKAGQNLRDYVNNK